MTNSINGLGGYAAIPPEPARGKPAGAASPTDLTFHQRLLESLTGPHAKPPAVQAGRGSAPVEALTTDQQAELSLQMMLEMRQRLLEAYREIQDIRT